MASPRHERFEYMLDVGAGDDVYVIEASTCWEDKGWCSINIEFIPQAFNREQILTREDDYLHDGDIHSTPR